MTEFKKLLWNDGWSFASGDIGADFSSAEFKEVEIPHDWLIYDTANLYKTGEGRYRKSFSLQKEAGVRYILRFDGVYMDSHVYVNGSEAGFNEYGYTTFEVDITDFVTDGENTVEVAVIHISPNTRWYSGAGIFRNVYLKRLPDMHIASDGIYISAVGDIVKASVEISVSCGSHYADKLALAVLDGAGATVATEEIPIKRELSCGEEITLEAEIAVSNPLKWSLEQRNLYTLTAVLYGDGGAVCRDESRFGFRSLRFDRNEGFFLNDSYIKLHGVCMHHDLGALGAAFNLAACKRQLEILKGMGVNAIRTSHNPPAPELMELCDEMGFLVDSEIFDMWEMPKTEYDYSRFFLKSYKKDVASWVRRDRNHPSLIMWSIGNEIADTNKERGREIAAMLHAEVKKHDPNGNAPTTIASNYMQWDGAQNCAKEVELAGYNYTERVYDEHHEKYPEWVIYGSETSSAVRSRGIYHFPLSASILTCEDMQCSDLGNSVVNWGSSAEKAWYMDRDRKYCLGQFIWTGFDYIGEPTPYSTKNSYFGIVDTAGFPKDIYYFYKSVWTAEPMIHLLPYWDWNEGEVIDVVAYTNAPEAELFLNGESLGRQSVDIDNSQVLHASWSVPYKKGTLVAKAYDRNGAVVAEDSRSSFGDPVRLVANPSKTELSADGRDICFIEISAVDENGEFVANASNRIYAEVSGAATLIGLDNGDSTDYDSYKGTSRRLFSGKLLAMVRATLCEGDITVKLSSRGLEPCAIRLSAKPIDGVYGLSALCGAAPSPETDEIPIRKIGLSADNTALSKEAPTAAVSYELFPKNATYNDIEVSAVLANGVAAPNATAVLDGDRILVTATGDGEFYLRAKCFNGGDVPKALSAVKFTASGIGEALCSPYKFVSACLFARCSEALGVIDGGALGGVCEGSFATYENIDFGAAGSRGLRLYLGNCTGASVGFEVWSGTPENGEKIFSGEFAENGGWNSFSPQDFIMEKSIKGINTLSFVFHGQVIFGGFEFTETNRAYERLYTADSDDIYGDDYKVSGTAVEGIGNNVVLEFRAMNFDHGARRITVCGRTPNDENGIQIRFTSADGVQTTQLIKFPHSEDYTELAFDIDEVSGINDVSFVFMPGSRFDFGSFRFE